MPIGGYQRHVIKSVTSEGDFELDGLQLKDTLYMVGGRCPGYYLEHGLSQLDAPGEYYFDQKSETLYLIPMKEHGDKTPEIFVAMSEPHPPPQPKGFYDWPINHADSRYVLTVLSSARNVQIKNIEFRWDFGGILVQAPSARIQNCNFGNLLHTGVKNQLTLKTKDRTRVQACKFWGVEYFGINSRAKNSWTEVSNSIYTIKR